MRSRRLVPRLEEARSLLEQAHNHRRLVLVQQRSLVVAPRSLVQGQEHSPQGHRMQVLALHSLVLGRRKLACQVQVPVQALVRQSQRSHQALALELVQGHDPQHRQGSDTTQRAGCALQSARPLAASHRSLTGQTGQRMPSVPQQ